MTCNSPIVVSTLLSTGRFRNEEEDEQDEEGAHGNKKEAGSEANRKVAPAAGFRRR
jgi:hypothetical protein